MPVEQRRFIRFSLDIPAVRFTKYGESVEALLLQISIGGCLLDWDETVYTGDEFRLLIQLPNKNWLPLTCKVLYLFPENGIGIRFLNITQFEQELIKKIISQNLANEGLPLQIDPFAQPAKIWEKGTEPKITDSRREKDEVLQKIMSSDN